MKSNKKKKEMKKALLWLSPALITTTILCLVPIIYNIYLSFTDYSLYKYNNYRFIGLKNYKEIFKTSLGSINSVLGWTFIYALSSQFVSFSIGTILALFLNKHDIKLKKIYRTLLIIPWAVPAFISILIWKGLMNYNFGAINGILTSIGLKKIPWLLDKNWARISAIIVNVWCGFPFLMVVVLGVLQSIPNELYEAASIDGATSFYSFKKITLPLLLYSVIPVLMLGFIMNFNNFGLYLLTEGGPVFGSIKNPGATDLLITYIFKVAFRSQRHGLAASYAVIVFLFMLMFFLINIFISKKFTDEIY